MDDVETFSGCSFTDISSYGSITHAEMLFRTNLLAIVGGGLRPRFSENVILILDDSTKQFVLQYTFQMPVLGVQLRKDKYGNFHAKNIKAFFLFVLIVLPNLFFIYIQVTSD